MTPRVTAGPGKIRPANITDVARTAGVSIGTVSRFINGFEVKKTNRERIETAISELSFSPNAFASGMKSEDSRMVALLVPGYGEFHAKLLTALVRSLGQEGLLTLTYCHEDSEDAIREALQFFRAHRVRALVMSGVDSRRDDIDAIRKTGVHVITYDQVTADASVDRVVTNNREAARTAVAELIRLGHTRIGVVSGAMTHLTARDRLQGWRDAFADAGIVPPEDLMVQGDWTADAGRRAMESLMRLPERPTALFSSNLQITLGVLGFCQTHNITLPDDLSLLSFDDIEMFQFTSPKVAAIEQPVAAIAETIQTMLRARFTHGGAPPPQSKLLNCAIHFRGSIAPPATGEGRSSKHLSATKGPIP